MPTYNIDGHEYHATSFNQARMAHATKLRRGVVERNLDDVIETLTAVEGGARWDGRSTYGTHFIDVLDHAEMIEVHGSRELRDRIVDFINESNLKIEISRFAEVEGHGITEDFG